MSNSVLFLFLAYGVLWLVPVALLVVFLVRLERMHREVATLRRRLDAVSGVRADAPNDDREAV